MWNFQTEKLCSLIMVNAEKWGAKIKKWGDANLLSPNVYVLPALFSQLLVFLRLCVMNTLLHFLILLCQSCRSLRNESLGGRILSLIKSSHHGWLSIMTSSEGPLFSLASGPPNPKPTTGCCYFSCEVQTLKFLASAKSLCVAVKLLMSCWFCM